ncbi:TrmH family RNA methyltransferase [Caminibacter pacificus]|jgi:23S rRNA (guanosine2251-2'-O)-methyltransferase|uniref:23S rRNA (Guanosine2251-2'-O)-methyltransferase n=1 Tax=Caminibacter pacificus TaxID=1424653 RepID=A0AAJ4UXE4_9BACT|nr:RNA methyltransferase [Caminibacter pacificus]QCI28807.1 RNA methyltransferase [Caminibacter pacificus]ROR39395.1 23S rRNA (guanosine2251-2'-O)-methyltransferase [Caminibacter pacificus]
MIVYGKRIVEYIIQKHPDIVKEILIAKKLSKNELKKFNKFKVKFIDNKTAQKLSKNGNHQGFFAKIDFTPQEWDITGDKILVLENVTDMGNIGAITRTAYALGIDLLIITGIKELKWDRVIRTSSGAALDMKILPFKNILELLNILKTKKYHLIGADLGGKCKPSKKEKIALIMGNEGEGLSKRVKEKLDEILTIEMKREFDSLNVSVAAGILIDRITNEC